jgi:glycosyltransferase involved in cell wall biosynthesis
MFEIELTAPLADLSLSAADTGASILVRRKGVPIGFWMQEADGSRRIPVADLTQRIGSEMGARILAEAIRDELRPSAPSIAPPLTIAICTKDRAQGVERLLGGLAPQILALPDGQRPEILVVDNAPSDDATRDLAARSPGVRYVREARPGLNFARNRALREARTELLAFLDDDVIPDQQWLAGLADAWAANRDAAAFTGQVLPMELETEAQVMFEQRGGFRRGFDRVRYGPVSPGNPLYPGGAGNFGAGANMTFSTAALRTLGGFDEALDTGAAVPGGGDIDAFYRIIRAGHALVYEPRFLVFHQHRREIAALRRQFRRSWGLGFMCYLTKCIRNDPSRRIPLLRLIVWWFTHHLGGLFKQLTGTARGAHQLPASILAGELWGGVVGLMGGYGRSVRQAEKIRQAFR